MKKWCSLPSQVGGSKCRAWLYSNEFCGTRREEAGRKEKECGDDHTERTLCSTERIWEGEEGMVESSQPMRENAK
jgi:hypothetical protein